MQTDRFIISALFIISAVCVTGCASKLEVYGANGTKLPGLPIRGTELYVKTVTHDKLKDGGECARTTASEVVTIPTGDVYYVNLAAGELSKSALSLKLTATGTVSEVSVNSEPSSDAIKAATTAATSLLPSLGVLPATAGKASAPVGATGGTAPLKACDSGEESVHLIKFSDFVSK